MVLTSHDLKSAFTRFDQLLEQYRPALNALNVYPVPDGDTGSNMAGTVKRVMTELDGATSMSEVTTAIGHGSLMGAKGNSGILLSVILSGLAETFRTIEAIGPDDLRAALDLAREEAYAAVKDPIEGTILSVMREAAEEAANSSDTDLTRLVAAVFSRAVDALERTPDALPVLRQAEVVDAGGAGLVLFFAALAEAALVDPVVLPDHLLMARPHLERLDADDAPAVSGLRYEVMFFLETEDEAMDAFRAAWDDIGDSIAVVGGTGTWNCHIHTDHIGLAIEAGIAAGRPYDIRVTDLLEASGLGEGEPVFVPIDEAAAATVGVVAVVAGDGLVDVFRSFGVQGVIRGGQTMNPSTEELLGVVESVPARKVIVLPNNRNIVPVAEQVDNLSEKSVMVVPTRSVPQGISAMIAWSQGSTDLAGTAEEMAAAASSVMVGEVTRAVRDATVGELAITAGDWLGLADGTIVVNGGDLEVVLRALVAELMPAADPEIVTVYTGEGAELHATKSLEAYLADLHPEVAFGVVEGGQPTHPYLISVE